jgi:hypothetical protein
LFFGGQGAVGDIPLFGTIIGILSGLRFPLLIMSALFIASTIYSTRKLQEIRLEEYKILYAGHDHDDHSAGEEVVNDRWVKVVQHINSENPTEWRMGILEADIILDEMLQKIGYIGQSLGERLKAIEPGDFTTINEAWEAHKARNQIAHLGSDYVLTLREARRIIGLYESVFREFKYI